MVAKLVTCGAVTIGAVATASSPGPITITGLAELSIWLAAGTASAGSPLVSKGLQASLAPSTPPAALTGAMPARQPAELMAPWTALSPVYGAITPMFSVPPELEPGPADPVVDETPHAPRLTVTAAAAASVFKNRGRPVAMPTSAS